MGGFCLLVELAQGGSVTNVAATSSYSSEIYNGRVSFSFSTSYWNIGKVMIPTAQILYI